MHATAIISFVRYFSHFSSTTCFHVFSFPEWTQFLSITRDFSGFSDSSLHQYCNSQSNKNTENPQGEEIAKLSRENYVILQSDLTILAWIGEKYEKSMKLNTMSRIAITAPQKRGLKSHSLYNKERISFEPFLFENNFFVGCRKWPKRDLV